MGAAYKEIVPAADGFGLTAPQKPERTNVETNPTQLRLRSGAERN